MSRRFYFIVFLIVSISISASIIIYLFLPNIKKNEQLLPKQRRPATNDPWLLISNKPDLDYGTYLANGYISTQIKGSGLGSNNNQPLQCFIAGLYNQEKLVPIPAWSDVRIKINPDYEDAFFQVDSNSKYNQTLDLKKGILTTKGTYRYKNKVLQGEIKIIVSRERKNIALITFDFIPNFNGKIIFFVPSYLDKQARSKFEYFDLANYENTNLLKTNESNLYLAINTHFEAEGVSRNYSKSNKYLDSIIIKAEKNRRFKVIYLVSISVNISPQKAKYVAESELKKAITIKPVNIEKEHISAWSKIWERNIMIDGSSKDQQIINSCMFYILQSVREDVFWSIPPLGLSSNGWNGHIFWDADLWIFHAISLLFPEFAKSIVEYRYNTMHGAKQNAINQGFKGAEFAWESGYSGIEATPKGLVYKYERHINGSVALAQWQYYLITKDLDWLKSKGYEVIKETADYWISRVTYNKALDRYEILKVVPPDENREFVNNSVYTNAIAKLNLKIATLASNEIGKPPNPKWLKIANKIYIPFDIKEQRFIAHDNDEGLSAKQADTELVIFPLKFILNGKNQADMQKIYMNTYNYYAPRVHRGGPAMASSVHSVIQARFDNCEEAYKKFTESYEPYLRGPFNNFNEKPSLYIDTMTFLTGASGPIKSVIYGFAGIDFDNLNAESKLTIKPCLPNKWKSVKINNIHFDGKKYNLKITKDKYDIEMIK